MKMFVLIFTLFSSFAANAGLYAPTAHPEMNSKEVARYAKRFYSDRSDEQTDSPPPEKIWKSIEHFGWPESLGDFQVRFQPGKSYLTLYKKLPFYPLDMRSANRFKQSMMASQLFDKSSIGHMSFGWSCSAGSSRVEGFAAQTGEDSGQQHEMMANGWGVTSALTTFTDGHLHNAFHIQRYFASDLIDRTEGQHIKANRYFALVVEVPLQECERVRTFVKNYVFHPSKPYENFGMLLDPLKFEGAGCGSFAISALSLSETMHPLTESYWRTISIAAKVLGRRTLEQAAEDAVPPISAKSPADEYVVGRLPLTLMNWDTGPIGMNVHFVDPELTVFSFRYLSELTANESPGSVTRYQRKKIADLVRTYNFQNLHGEDVDTTDKDSGFQEIDAYFDPGFTNVAKTIDHWTRALPQGTHPHLVSFPFGVGVMVDSSPLPLVDRGRAP